MIDVFIGGLIAILTLVVNKLFDYLQRKQENKYYIKRFFLEKKVNAGEQAVAYWQDVKSLLESIGSFFNSMPEKPSSNFGKIFSGTFDSYKKQLDKLFSATNANNAIYLYYDLDSSIPANKNLKNVVESFNSIGNKDIEMQILKQMLKDNPDEAMKKLIRDDIKRVESEAINELYDLAKVFKSGSEVYNDLMKMLRDEIKKLETLSV